jgi:ubiquinone/menaquinone biosynthesis C-methylase UbiE
VTTDREYMPAGTTLGGLRLYDPLGRLLGANAVRWQLVAQACIEPGATVLEVGCGTGGVLLPAKRAVPGATVVGLDPDPDALEVARRRARRAGLALQLDRGYADRLPYADGSVDRVLSSFMLHHLPDDQQRAALREVHRVLVPGGRLHLVDFDGPPNGPVGRLIHRPGRHGHGHGHGHGELRPTFGTVPQLLAEAGFTDAVEAGRGKTPIGEHVFWRATR